MCAPPDYTPLDNVDRGILQLLQRDARHLTAVDISERIDVSDGTIRNRIEKLEERNVIEGYAPLINYERAGYQLQIKIVCTASVVDREALARDALQVEGVVEVQELMTGTENVEITAVAPGHDDLTRIAKTLDGMGLAVERETLLRHRYARPFDHFGTDDVAADESGTHEL